MNKYPYISWYKIKVNKCYLDHSNEFYSEDFAKFFIRSCIKNSIAINFESQGITFFHRKHPSTSKFPKFKLRGYLKFHVSIMPHLYPYPIIPSIASECKFKQSINRWCEGASFQIKCIPNINQESFKCNIFSYILYSIFLFIGDSSKLSWYWKLSKKWFIRGHPDGQCSGDWN